MFKHTVNVEAPEKVVVEHRVSVLIAPNNFKAAESFMKTTGKVAVTIVAAKTVSEIAMHIAKTAIK